MFRSAKRRICVRARRFVGKHRGNIRILERRSEARKKPNPNEQVLPYDLTHKCLIDPTRRLKKRKKKFYSPLPEGAPVPDYTAESSYDYGSSSASDSYSFHSDPENAESKA